MDVCQGTEHGLYDAAHSRDANKRIGNEPCCNACKSAGDAELEDRRRDPMDAASRLTPTSTGG